MSPRSGTYGFDAARLAAVSEHVGPIEPEFGAAAEIGAAPEINAITLFTTDMAASVEFYLACGMDVAYGGADAVFTSLRHGRNFVNLSSGESAPPGLWGRVIFHVASPDATWRALVRAGYRPEFEPRDAPWGERYFHVRDPDGHELSFARRLD